VIIRVAGFGLRHSGLAKTCSRCRTEGGASSSPQVLQPIASQTKAPHPDPLPMGGVLWFSSVESEPGTSADRCDPWFRLLAFALRLLRPSVQRCRSMAWPPSVPLWFSSAEFEPGTNARRCHPSLRLLALHAFRPLGPSVQSLYFVAAPSLYLCSSVVLCLGGSLPGSLSSAALQFSVVNFQQWFWLTRRAGGAFLNGGLLRSRKSPQEFNVAGFCAPRGAVKNALPPATARNLSCSGGGRVLHWSVSAPRNGIARLCVR